MAWKQLRRAYQLSITSESRSVRRFPRLVHRSSVVLMEFISGGVVIHLPVQALARVRPTVPRPRPKKLRILVCSAQLIIFLLDCLELARDVCALVAPVFL